MQSSVMHSKNRIRDPLKDKDRFVTILKGWIDQFALSMTNSDTKNYIQQLLIEPFLEYIFQRAFPYAIVAICIVLSIFIIVIIIFILLLLNRNKCIVCNNVV
jgi:predicted membrane metal-binding protein